LLHERAVVEELRDGHRRRSRAPDYGDIAALRRLELEVASASAEPRFGAQRVAFLRAVARFLVDRTEQCLIAHVAQLDREGIICRDRISLGS
jgi:hypothetical protein